MKSIHYYDQVPAQLRERIMHEIIHRQRKSLIQQRVFAATELSVSVFASAISIKVMLSNVFQSGADQFIALAYSDTDVVLEFGSDFVSLMIETIPLLSLAAVLAAFAAVLVSIGYVIREYRGRSFIPVDITTAQHYA
jgi:hypothetical protein